MLHFYFLNSSLEAEEIIRMLKDYKAILIRPELAGLKGFLEWSNGKAREDFRGKSSVADDFNIQWLCRIACTRNIRKALEFCMPAGKEIAIVSGKGIGNGLLREMGRRKDFKIDRNLQNKLAGEYEISKNALENYDFGKLLAEKSIVRFLE